MRHVRILTLSLPDQDIYDAQENSRFLTFGFFLLQMLTAAMEGPRLGKSSCGSNVDIDMRKDNHTNMS
jgi:hypothetical protein